MLSIIYVQSHLLIVTVSVVIRRAVMPTVVILSVIMLIVTAPSKK